MTLSENPNTSRMLLSRYLEEVYIPDKMRTTGLSERTAQYYRVAVRQLDLFVGREVRCVEVDDLMLHKYQIWMLEHRLTHKTASTRMHNIRGLLRHWSPEIYGPKPTLPPMPEFIDADIEGTLDYVCMELYFPEQTKIASSGTIKHYARAVRLFGECLGRVAVVADLTDANAGRFLRWLVGPPRNLKPVSANGYIKQLLALWRWMADKRLISQRPTLDLLTEAEVTPLAWTKGELRQLMEACRSATGSIAEIPAKLWWPAFHLVLWDTGERTGAMLELRWEWLDWRTGYLSVPGEFRKGRRKSMTYPLKRETLDSLRLILTPARERIFPVTGPDVCYATMRARFHAQYRRLVKAAKLPYVKFKCGPQRMRRTFASNIEAAGGNATRALRHTDRRVTEESYLDPRIAETWHENDCLGPLEEGGDEAVA